MQLGVEFVDLTAVSIPVELASYVPKNIAKKFCVVPVKLVKDTLYLAMSDPLDFVAQEEVKVASRKRVIPMIATRHQPALRQRGYGRRHRGDEARGGLFDAGHRPHAGFTGGDGLRRQRADDPLCQQPH